MRFDDTLETVLATDVDSASAAQSAWRQLVDLIGRGQASADPRAIALLDAIRGRVPLAIRVASVRPLESCAPPAELVALIAVDDLAVALPVLRTAKLDNRTWIELLPRLTPPARSVLRNRRDLSPAVRRALAAYGPTDLVLGGVEAPAETPAPRSAPADWPERAPTFVPLGKVALDMPVVAEAVRRQGSVAEEGPFEIADVVARIDAFQREREQAGPVPFPTPPPPAANQFRFETDRFGTVNWIEGVNRPAVLGLALAHPGTHEGTGADAIISGALRRRAAFRDARLTIDGRSDAAGDWLLSAVPVFDPESGRFEGYRGTARRPRRHERAEAGTAPPPADSMRQLVHELRTPANAISGFAEMIESQMLGPVPDIYRERAGVIREQAQLLIAAIDDLDLAARIDGNSLDLHPQSVAVRPMIAAIVDDLSALIALRGAVITLAPGEVQVDGDPRALERLFGRLFATIAASASRDEAIGVRFGRDGGAVRIEIDRPAALSAEFDGQDSAAHDDVLLLGADFALRLARNLARELGGAFEVEASGLIVTLPDAETHDLPRANRH